MFHDDADVGVKVCGMCYMKGEQAHAGFPEAGYTEATKTMINAWV